MRTNINDADGSWQNAPIWNFNDKQVKFDTNFVDNANSNYGSASGFLPKSLLNQEKPRPIFIWAGLSLRILRFAR